MIERSLGGSSRIGVDYKNDGVPGGGAPERDLFTINNAEGQTGKMAKCDRSLLPTRDEYLMLLRQQQSLDPKNSGLGEKAAAMLRALKADAYADKVRQGRFDSLPENVVEELKSWRKGNRKNGA